MTKRRLKIVSVREHYEAPECVQRVFEIYGGRNRFGEPNFRAVWSESHLDWLGGKITDIDEATGIVLREVYELRRVPKYSWIANRWIIERWYPPEHWGSPEAWYEKTKKWKDEGNIPQLGPYPFRGRYALCTIVQDTAGNFIQLTQATAEEIVLQWEIERLKKAKSDLQLQADIRAEKDAMSAAQKKQGDENVAYLNSLAPGYEGNGAPTVGFGGVKQAARIEEGTR